MTIVNKENIRASLQSELEEKLFEFAEESLELAGQSLDSLDETVRIQIRAGTRKQAEKLAAGIAEGLNDMRLAINENVNKINDLENRLDELSTSVAAIPVVTTP